MKKVKWICSSMLFVVGIIITFFLEKIMSNNSLIISIPLGTLIGGILLLFSIIVWFICFSIQEHHQFIILNKTIKNLENENAKIANMNTLSNDNGTLYLLMALSQDTYEPLKIKLLKKSATEYKNTLAAIILAGLYKSGLKNNENTILNKNLDAALELYEKVNDCDTFGITDWLIGFSYENNQTSKSKSMTEELRRKTAMQYYKKSAEKNFPKAENSIGKFYHYGWVTGQGNETEAIGHFQKAADAGDVYALMNCGHSEIKRYYNSKEIGSLYNAQKYYLKASDYDNSEAWLWMGIVSEERAKFENDRENELLIMARDYYIKSFLRTENKFSATGLYRLGCLIQNHPKFEKDSCIVDALKAEDSDDLMIKCFSTAYSLFHTLYEQNRIQPDRYMKYYDSLKKSFRGIEGSFEDDFI